VFSQLGGCYYIGIMTEVSVNNFLLTVNRGSSSIKCTLFSVGVGDDLQVVRDWTVSHIGNEPETPIKDLIDSIAALTTGSSLSIGHRITHGGPHHTEHTIINTDVLVALKEAAVFAPLHTPVQLACVDVFLEAFPDAMQFACFDTAFFSSLPRVAKQTGLPRRFEAEGAHRYGFHGLSYEYVIQRLEQEVGPSIKEKRCVVAHLGSGVSLAAIHRGLPVDTTMGMTPNSGVPMSTRLGDIDSGLIAYLHTKHGMGVDEFMHMVNFESGLLGVSGLSADMEQLINEAKQHDGAEDAVAFFCQAVKKQIAALAATMGGIDVLIFTGGMGDKAPVIRERACEGLQFLGIALAAHLNETNQPRISSDESRIPVYVIPTNEALVMAQHGVHLMK